MKRTTALAAAGALVLTVAGGISTLAVIDRPATDDPPVIIQYVDQAGNPVPSVTGAPFRILTQRKLRTGSAPMASESITAGDTTRRVGDNRRSWRMPRRLRPE